MIFLERLDVWGKNKQEYRDLFLFNPYFIAEIGVNHEGSIQKAKELIRSAADNGANAVKFQSYKAERLTSIDSPAYWDIESESTPSQFELFKKYDNLDFEDYFELKDYSDECGVEFLTTPFDEIFVEELDDILDFYKVASADITNYPLLKKIASKNKPLILSTGASSKEEINSALDFLDQYNIEVLLNHCILSYPTQIENANLGMIEDLILSYPENIIGYSDHTPPQNDFYVQILSSLLGATFIEKHFTLDKDIAGNDHYHSFDGDDLREFRLKLSSLKDIYGKNKKEVIPIEEPARKNARRSLVFAIGMKKGEIITKDSLVPKRPGTGVSPKELETLIGRKLNQDVEGDSHLKLDMLD